MAKSLATCLLTLLLQGRGEHFHLFGDNYHGTGLKFDPFSEKF